MADPAVAELTSILLATLNPSPVVRQAAELGLADGASKPGVQRPTTLSAVALSQLRKVAPFFFWLRLSATRSALLPMSRFRACGSLHQVVESDAR